MDAKLIAELADLGLRLPIEARLSTTLPEPYHPRPRQPTRMVGPDDAVASIARPLSQEQPSPH
jgi:hypothetical protein